MSLKGTLPGVKAGPVARRAVEDTADLLDSLGHEITERDPDTLRGADFAFYSYTQVPKGSFPKRGYLKVPPDLVVEVRSPDDRWKNILSIVCG